MNTAERASRLVAMWAGVYTRRLPTIVALDRRAELASDLWEQRAQAQAIGQHDSAVAMSILWRTVSGMPSDLSWRHAQLANRPGRRLRPAGTSAAHVIGESGLARIRRFARTRRCLACGERYERAKPYCPVCKTLPGHDGINRGPPRIREDGPLPD